MQTEGTIKSELKEHSTFTSLIAALFCFLMTLLIVPNVSKLSYQY